MATFDQLVRNASKAAQQAGGLTSALLNPTSRRKHDVKWDPKRARFRAGDRQQIVVVTRVRKELDRLEARQLFLARKYNQLLFSGEWDLNRWESEMTTLIENTHTEAGGLATGSLQNSARSSTVTRRIERDLQALKRFRADIKAKRVPTLALANNRARAYARSPFVTYHLLNQRNHIDAGFKQGRRRLTAAEHCRTKPGTEGCLEAAARGWMPITEVPPIGTLVCAQFCKCWIQYA